jgi:hypothetical protein
MSIIQSCGVWHHVLCSNWAKLPRNVLRNFFGYPTLKSCKSMLFRKHCRIYVRPNGISSHEVHKVTGMRNSNHNLCDASRRITVDMVTQGASNFGKQQKNFSTSCCTHALWRRNKWIRNRQQARLFSVSCGHIMETHWWFKTKSNGSISLSGETGHKLK